MINRCIYLLGAAFLACSVPAGAKGAFSEPRPYVKKEAQLSIAVFAGGCFWCMEPPFEKLAGVKAVISGYAGGKEKNPTYDEVSYGRSSHIESVLVLYDPRQVSYEQLLGVFWRNINPEQEDGQFYDVGPQYKTYIFYGNDTERREAEKSKGELLRSGKFKRVATRIVPATAFWPAEDYHQDYYKKNPAHYQRYRVGSGRDAYLKRLWN
ncbi:MAG: peptide-methionine (S)-S-oxide reductase MsrA [Spirochaetota bacterium]